MKKHFNVDAYTARLIGRESLAKVDSAVIELVKNGYDADAKVSIVYYDEINKTIYICDNGCGMTEEIIDKHWMTIGNSSKRDECVTTTGRVQTGSKGIGRFALDRIGAKCNMLTLNSVNGLQWIVNWNEFSHEKLITDIYAEIIHTDIDFNEFVLECNNDEFKKLIAEYFLDKGTIFKIENLNDKWDKIILTKVRKALDNIAIPGMSDVFKMYFFTNKDTIETAYINPNRIEESDYEIKFEINNQIINITLKRNEFDFGDKFDEIIKVAKFTEEDVKLFKGEEKKFKFYLDEFIGGYEEDVYRNLGDIYGELYFNKLSVNKKDKETYFYKEITGRRKYTKEFGGIKIYRDNFRVRPYGDYHSFNFDWLMLSQRKQASPAAISNKLGAWKVNSEQMTGIINISRVNKALEDQANRDGLVENKEYELLRHTIIKVISLFEEDRQYVARSLREYNNTINPYNDAYNEILNKIKKMENNKNQQKELIDKKGKNQKNISDNEIKEETNFDDAHIETQKVKIVIEEKDNIIRDLEDENSLLASLATTGIMANTYIHEIRTLNVNLFAGIISISDRLRTIRKKIKELFIYNLQDESKEKTIINNLIDGGINSLEKVNQLKEKYNSWYDITINNIQKNRTLIDRFNIVEILSNIKESWENVLNDKNIAIEFIYNEEEIIRSVSPREVESIFHNLITNSVSAFETARFEGSEKKIIIELFQTTLGFEFLYQDNGPGLDKAFRKNPNEILKPFVSSATNSCGERIGTGMGMWIVEKFVKQYNGKVDLSLNKNNEVGFYIKISMNRRKKYDV